MPDDDDVEWILSQNEGQNIEFKQAVSSSLGRSICAFANSHGGTIVVGVRPRGTIQGLSDPSAQAARVQSIARGCSPIVKVRVEHFTVEGKSLLLVNVPESSDKPHSSGSVFYMRVGSTSQSMTRDEVVGLLHAVGKIKFENGICETFHYPRDISRKAFDNFVERAGISRKVSRTDVLVNLGVAQRSGENLNLSNAGILFFARQPPKFLAHAIVDCVLFQGWEKITILDRKELMGDLMDNVEQAMAFLKHHLSLRYEIKGLYRSEILELPEEALREALLNAVMHRDYSFDTARISVEIYRDRVEISSPGGLPQGLSRDEFGTKSVHRNHLLANLFQRMGEVEQVGSGIKRMREAMRDRGLPDPKFTIKNFFTITFQRQGAQGMAHDEAHDMAHDESTVLRSRLSMGMLRLCGQPRSAPELLTAMGQRTRSAGFTRALRLLVDGGFVRYTIPEKHRSKGQRYIITEKGRRVLDATR
jgi:ATP-dependent DNA helicase RecG